MNVPPLSVRKRGFTLVEILVVVGIVVFLAAVLVPTIQGALKRSRAAGSQSNLHQLGVYFQQYFTDNGYKVPPATFVDPTIGPAWMSRVTWDSSLMPYASDDASFKKTLRSPADRLPRTGGGIPRTYAMVKGNGMGENLGIGSVVFSGDPSIKPFRSTILEKPDSIILLTERVSPGNVALADAYTFVNNPTEQTNISEAVPAGSKNYGAKMYGGKFNYLFLDGHVEFLNPTATIGTGSLTSPKGGWTWKPND